MKPGDLLLAHPTVFGVFGTSSAWNEDDVTFVLPSGEPCLVLEVMSRGTVVRARVLTRVGVGWVSGGALRDIDAEHVS